jgi:hypothetical protein
MNCLSFRRKINYIRNIYLLIFLLGSNFLFSQDVVISGYFNAVDPRDEWTELLVVGDNIDLRNWTIRDNNSTQTSWQSEITFLNIPFWSALRSGTIIMLYHRVINSASVTYSQDTDPSDGYIQLNLQNSSYFSGGSFGTSPTWAGNSMSIAADGEVVQLRNSSSIHIHALGHRSTVGSSWTALSSPKLNHKNNASAGDAIFICPGSNLSEYGTSTPQDGTTWTTKNSTNLTFGLPNVCGGSSIANSNFWNSLREPIFNSQTVSSSTSPTYPTAALTFTWNSATDPVSTDQTTGYMVVRSINGVFGVPVDGTIYPIGSTISGGGDVIDYVDHFNSLTHSYSDFTANNNGTYCYRVYAYRYDADNINGNSFNASRGRAYNTNSFVEVICAANPLPIELIEFKAKQINKSVELNWITASEKNNAFFTVERSKDGEDWDPVSFINSQGNSSTHQYYKTYDYSPFTGNSYYRLKQSDFDGSYSYSNVILLNMISDERKLIKKIDLLGREVNDDFTGISLFIYDNGDIEKVIRVKG